jgi:hypothetical protein
MKPIRDESIISESTQRVSSASKIPMDFDEFKRRYNELLDSYMGENKYYNELTFVKMWFSRYSKLSDLLQKTTKPEPLTPIEKRGLKALGTKDHYSNLEISFSLICKFLKQKRRQVKAELKSNLESPQQNEILNLNVVKNKKPDSNIPHIIMNEAILSIQESIIEDKKSSKRPENAELVEVKSSQHTQIFKGNAFEVWQSMFEEFKITKSSRTDIDFMFQVMKYNNLIHNNIGLIDIKDWINENYQIAVEKVKYTDPSSKANKKRMSTYSLVNSI